MSLVEIRAKPRDREGVKEFSPRPTSPCFALEGLVCRVDIGSQAVGLGWWISALRAAEARPLICRVSSGHWATWIAGYD